MRGHGWFVGNMAAIFVATVEQQSLVRRMTVLLGYDRRYLNCVFLCSLAERRARLRGYERSNCVRERDVFNVRVI